MSRRMSRPGRSRTRSKTLRMEALEDRRVLASFVVNDLGDTSDAAPGDGVAEDAAGNTTLRAAIEEANALGGADDIRFSVGGNILLTTAAQLQITDDLVIDGEANNITVDGGGATRVMLISDGDGVLNNVNVELRSVTLTGGFSTDGAGISNFENTTMVDVVVTGNVIEQPNASYSGFGGGILNSADLLIRGGAITNNMARDPLGTPQGNAIGGGISNYQVDANLIVEDSFISGNLSTDGGGGIHGQQNSVTIRRTTVSDNTTGTTGFFGGYGGGIAMFTNAYGATQAPMNLVIEESTISGNTTSIGTIAGQGYSFPYGGGIYAGGQGTVSIRDSSIINNETTGTVGGYTPLARGGGAFFAGFNNNGLAAALDVTIERTQFVDNLAFSQGGAMAVRGRDTSAVNVTVSDSMIRGNSATRYQGGALWTWGIGNSVVGQSNLMVEDSTITGNTANNGGGSFSWFGGYTRFERTTFDSNYGIAYGGNAIDNRGVNLQGGQLTGRANVIDSTFSNNYGYGLGGAIFNYDSELNISQATISGNTGLNGGAIYLGTYGPYVGTALEYFAAIDASTITDNYGIAGGGLSVNDFADFTVSNTIVSGNADASGSPDVLSIANPNVANAFRYSFVGDASGSSLVPGNPDANGNRIGDAVMPLDAMLGPLANNGGPTLTHLPNAGSPVIDAGDPGVMGGTDQRGFARVADGRVDIGSVETGSMVVDGDFNNDMVWDCADIDALVAAIVAGGNDPSFDMNGDGLVNAADITDPLVGWLAVGGANNPGATGGNPFLEGDANLDGVVDGQDFIVWNANKFTAVAAWCSGDFTADGVVDGQDFIVWNANKFMASDRVGPRGLAQQDLPARPRDWGVGGRAARPESRDSGPMQGAANASVVVAPFEEAPLVEAAESDPLATLPSVALAGTGNPLQAEMVETSPRLVAVPRGPREASPVASSAEADKEDEAIAFEFADFLR